MTSLTMDRLLRNVEPEPMSGCWLWSAGCSSTGYGAINVEGKTIPAHRASWFLFKGEIPNGMFVDHRCRQRSCVNPDHLRLVTPRENVLENSIGRAAANAKKTHCAKGHEFSGENLLVTKRGSRKCRTCMREECRAEYARNRDKHLKRMSLYGKTHRLQKRERDKRWIEAHKDDPAWVERRKATVRRYLKLRSKDPEFRERQRAALKRWRQKNREPKP